MTAALPTMVPAEEVKVPRCRLLELPEELQLDIFELVVTSENKIRLGRMGCVGYGHDLRPRSLDTDQQLLSDLQLRRLRMQPAITRVCRSTRKIALPAYYKQNAFELCFCVYRDFEVAQRVASVKPWLEAIGASNRAMCRNFIVHEFAPRGRFAIDWTEALPGGLQDLGAQCSALKPFHERGWVHNRFQVSFTE
ncbi:hypothetical protein LTR56_014081 [Elasticomyces elasticus]|nr:hypothetical protein LTR22_019997 [Elasticomyces elasticus]KAK3636608.1 hypothetical protein LTR56_014081 [Elasticomyces elasticus]KAK4910920.1 hypothetical protein LTR49_020446 [Elasticomyces elasticus]KAK5760005.1 hypothetical protein LTS12_009901 [Elasticomyces elasticus]